MSKRTSSMIRNTLSAILLTASILFASFAPTLTHAQTSVTYPGLATDNYADIPGARLFYVDTGGNGTPVVLMHAGSGNARFWEHQIPAFVAKGYRVIAYDRRGADRTTINPAGPAGTPADDLDALMTYLGIDKFILVGTAAGGIYSTDYAISYPHKLYALVLANSLVGIVDSEVGQITSRILPYPFSQMPADFRELGPTYRVSNLPGTQRWNELEHFSFAPPPRPLPQPNKNRVTLQMLESLNVPTLIISGYADLYSPPPFMQLVASRIPHAKTLWITEVGHSAYWETPDIFNKAVLKFIRKHKHGHNGNNHDDDEDDDDDNHNGHDHH